MPQLIGMAQTISEWTGSGPIEAQLEEFLLRTNRFERRLAELFKLRPYPWHKAVNDIRRSLYGIGPE